MQSVRNMIRKHGFLLLIILISGFAFLLRVISCFWGYPKCLHPDEAVIVESAMDMLSRHSWEAYCYFRPDQVEIKCDALLFTLVSWIRYHKPAFEAFREHEIVFYIIARFFTALFGTAIIPLGVSFVGKLLPSENPLFKRTSQIMTALILAFSAIFVEHSAYATPDVILAFILLLFARLLLWYLENGSKFAVYACAVVIGFGVATKYPAAILCIPLAIAVIYRSVSVEKKPLMIIKYGISAALIAVFTVFVIAPNLFTDYQTVYVYFMNEVNDKHLDKNGHGFFGNLAFYFLVFCNDIGAISAIFSLVGLRYFFKNLNAKWFALLTGFIYWICISVLDLQWLRWGIPQYAFYIVLSSVGIGYVLWIFKEKLSVRRFGKAYMAVFYVMLILFSINVLVSGVCQTKFTRIPDTRLTSEDYLSEHGIDRDNTVFTYRTPYSPADGLPEQSFFDHLNDYVKVVPQFAAKQYYLTDNYIYDSYKNAKNKPQDLIDLHDDIEQKYQLIFKENADGNYQTHPSILANLYRSACYLMKKFHATGSTILVYDLAPQYVTLKNAKTGRYLSFLQDENGELSIALTQQPSTWILYENADQTTTLINADYKDENYLQYALIPGNMGLILQADNLDLASAEGLRLPERQWKLSMNNNRGLFVNEAGNALSVNEKGLSLEKANDSSEWIIEIRDESED